MAMSPLKSAFEWLRNKAIRLADQIEAENRSKLPATALERRILLSGTPMITIDGRVATITAGACADDDSDDLFELEKSSGAMAEYRITLNDGTTTDIGKVSDIDEIKIIGSDDNDRFQIYQDSIPINGLVIDGADGTNDAVEIITPTPHSNFDRIAYSISDAETSVSFIEAGSATTTAHISGVESVSDTLAAAERDVQITASESTVTIEEVDNPTSPDVVVEVGADRTVSFETPTTTLDVSVDNAASQHIDIIQFDESSIDLFVTSGGSDVLNVGTNDFVRAKEVSLSSGTVEVESELTATNGGLLLKADTSVIIQANLLSDNSLEIKDAIGVTINASANRVFQSTNSDILLDSVGTIELTGGSQLISMIADQDARLSDVAATGALVNGASLNVQAGENVNLKSVSLDGTTTDGSLTVSFDTNNSATNTLRVDGNISNVSTLQFTGGTDANDIVDINADIVADSIAIQDFNNVLIDASVSRNSDCNGWKRFHRLQFRSDSVR